MSVYVVKNVTECGECPNENEFKCVEKDQKQIEDLHSIPDWCPCSMDNKRSEDMKFLKQDVLTAWEGRAKAMAYDTQKKLTTKLQLEFIMGALFVLDKKRADESSCIPPSIYFNAMDGRYIEKK